MAQRPIVILDTTGPTLDVPQGADTYLCETDLAVTGDISVTGTVDGRDVASDGALAASALQPADVGTAAAEDVGYFATAAQGGLADSALQNVVEDLSPQLGAALDCEGFDINEAGVIFLREPASAEADVAGQGQFWVQTATPNVPMFTDDTGTDFNLLQDVFTTDITTVADQDYVLWYDAPYAGKITMIRSESVSGTCTLTGKVNTTALGGTANSVSSTAEEQSHSTTNTFAKGDKVLYTISSNSTCLNLAATFYITRTA